MHITCVLLLALIVGATSDAKAYFRWKRAAAMKTAAPAPKAPNPKKEVATAPKPVKAAAPQPTPKPTKGAAAPHKPQQQILPLKVPKDLTVKADAAPSPKPTKGAAGAQKPHNKKQPLDESPILVHKTTKGATGAQKPKGEILPLDESALAPVPTKGAAGAQKPQQEILPLDESALAPEPTKGAAAAVPNPQGEDLPLVHPWDSSELVSSADVPAPKPRKGTDAIPKPLEADESKEVPPATIEAPESEEEIVLPMVEEESSVLPDDFLNTFAYMLIRKTANQIRGDSQLHTCEGIECKDHWEAVGLNHLAQKCDEYFRSDNWEPGRTVIDMYNILMHLKDPRYTNRKVLNEIVNNWYHTTEHGKRDLRDGFLAFYVLRSALEDPEKAYRFIV